MDKSRSAALRKESGLEESRENRGAAMSGCNDVNKLKHIDEDFAACQMQIVGKMNNRDVLFKSMFCLITAREKILLYDDHAEYARRKLKEAREAIYLMADVDDINLAAEFEEKIQAAIKRLAELEEKPLRAEHKAELSRRIAETENILQGLLSQNKAGLDTLEKDMTVIARFREAATAKRRNTPLTMRNVNDKK